VIDPIVDAGVFARAQKILAERRLEIPDDEMLRRLRVLLHRKGKLSSSLINSALGVSSASSLVKHFGSVRKAFTAIGYVPTRDCDWIDTRDKWAAVAATHALQVAGALTSKARGGPSRITAEENTVRINGKVAITFLVARHARKRKASHAANWRVYRRQKQSGLLAVLRLDAANVHVLDYVVIAALVMKRRYLWLSNPVQIPAIRVDTLPQLFTEIRSRRLPGTIISPARSRRTGL
jgi:hypothetical protein